jgi:hypothetical protein
MSTRNKVPIYQNAVGHGGTVVIKVKFLEQHFLQKF